LCVVEFKTVAPLLRYSNYKNTVSLKPRLGSLKVIEMIPFDTPAMTSY